MHSRAILNPTFLGGFGLSSFLFGAIFNRTFPVTIDLLFILAASDKCLIRDFGYKLLMRNFGFPDTSASFLFPSIGLEIYSVLVPFFVQRFDVDCLSTVKGFNGVFGTG
jgi:hypothetical protein